MITGGKKKSLYSSDFIFSNQGKLKPERTYIASLFLNSLLLNSDVLPSNKPILGNLKNTCRENLYPLLKTDKY